MKRLFLGLLVVALAVGGLMFAQSIDLDDHVRAWNRSVIRISRDLLHVDANSELYFHQIDDHWHSIKRSLHWHYTFDRNRKATGQEIDDLISEFIGASQDKNWDQAIYYLDEIKYLTGEWFRIHQIDYNLVELWNFECAMRDVVNIASDELLELVDWKVLVWMHDEMDARWNQIIESQILFAVEGPTFNIGRKAMEGISHALTDFDLALESADGDQLAASAFEVRLQYARLLEILAAGLDGV